MHQNLIYYENRYRIVYTDDQFKKSAEKSTNYQEHEVPNGILIYVSCLQIFSKWIKSQQHLLNPFDLWSSFFQTKISVSFFNSVTWRKTIYFMENDFMPKSF